ncbi:unnamed protein product [Lampetra planeri]
MFESSKDLPNSFIRLQSNSDINAGELKKPAHTSQQAAPEKKNETQGGSWSLRGGNRRTAECGEPRWRLLHDP